MKTNNSFAGIASGQEGAIAIMVAILSTVLLGFAAFAIDLPNLMVARNELQNAADAGALAGARYLYLDTEDGAVVNAGASEIAENAARANFSQKTAVEVPNVERGHWALDTRTFTGYNTLPTVAACDELVINAVRVRVARSATPVASFFARVFGNDGFAVTAEAIAWIGYAADLPPWEYDMPIAICKQSIMQGDSYSCTIGRMLNSGSNTATSNTAGWTNFTQPCDTANASEMRGILNIACQGDGANEDPVTFGDGIGAVNGVQQNVLDELAACWKNGKNDGALIDTDGDGVPDQPWQLMLPVIDCPGNSVSNCAEVRGAVEVDVVWIQNKEIPDSKLDSADPTKVPCDTIPCAMGAWSNTSPVARTRWNFFVKAFNLQNAAGQPPDPTNKAIYFKPECTPHEPAGTSGGGDFCVRAKYPLLVQ